MLRLRVTYVPSASHRGQASGRTPVTQRAGKPAGRRMSTLFGFFSQNVLPWFVTRAAQCTGETKPSSFLWKMVASLPEMTHRVIGKEDSVPRLSSCCQRSPWPFLKPSPKLVGFFGSRAPLQPLLFKAVSLAMGEWVLPPAGEAKPPLCWCWGALPKRDGVHILPCLSHTASGAAAAGKLGNLQGSPPRGC